MMNTIANAHICLLNDFMRLLSSSVRITSYLAELSPDAIKKLDDSRDGWQTARSHDFSDLLLMTKLVAWGVILEGPELVFELINVIKRWFKKDASEHAPSWITLIGLVGWILVAVGVAGEFWVDGRVNSDDENIQSINQQLLADTRDAAGKAEASAHSAAGDATQAKSDAGDAKNLATGARKEADALSGEVKSANEHAVDAERHLADALKQASAAQEELNLMKAPRLLTNASMLADALRPFAGTEYTFSLMGSDNDSLNLLKQVDAALQLAGWKRVKPTPPPVIGITVNDFGKDFVIATGFADGVEVSVESTETAESLRSRKSESWPPLVRAASTLRNGLAGLITPREHNVQPSLVVQSGTSPTVRITVGSKVVISNSQ